MRKNPLLVGFVILLALAIPHPLRIVSAARTFPWRKGLSAKFKLLHRPRPQGISLDRNRNGP